MVDLHSLCWSLGRWGGKCSAQEAYPWGVLQARLRRCPRGEQQGGTCVILLSTEHTKFTWSQKTWEDKLIQVKR